MTTENNENLNEVKEVAAHKDKPQKRWYVVHTY